MALSQVSRAPRGLRPVLPPDTDGAWSVHRARWWPPLRASRAATQPSPALVFLCPAARHHGGHLQVAPCGASSVVTSNRAEAQRPPGQRNQL